MQILTYSINCVIIFSMQNYMGTALMVAKYLLLFFALFLILQRVDTYFKNTAINDCSKIATFEKIDTTQGTKVTYPLQDIYQDCLQKKGL